jgi:hypothetical protein
MQATISDIGIQGSSGHFSARLQSQSLNQNSPEKLISQLKAVAGLIKAQKERGSFGSPAGPQTERCPSVSQ